MAKVIKPQTLAELLRNPQKLLKAIEVLGALERLEVLTDTARVSVRISELNSVIDLRSAANTSAPITLPPSTTLDPETIVWRDRADAAGGTFAGDSIAVADALIIAIKATAYNSKIKWLLPLLGSNLATARVPLRDTLGVGIAANSGFVDADFSQSTGLQGNGAKLLNSGINAFQLGIDANGGMGYWERAVGTLPWVLGSRSGPDSTIFGLGLWTDELFYYGDGNSPARTLAAAGNHHYYGQRASATDRVLYRNGSSIATDTDNASIAGIGNNIMVMAIDSSNFGNGRCGVAYLTDGTLGTGEISSLHTLLGTYLITATGR